MDPHRNVRFWLPPDLLAKALKKAPKLGRWSLETQGRLRQLVLTRSDGTVFTGSYVVTPARVQVTVTITRPKPAKK